MKHLTLCLTNTCDHDCLICPSSRADGKQKNFSQVRDMVRKAGPNLEHVTITGGEPSLVDEILVGITKYIHEVAPHALIQILTNGGYFSQQEYTKRFKPYLNRVYWEIPLHSHDAHIFNKITRTEGSYDNAIVAIETLLESGATVYVRLVLNALNVPALQETVCFICKKLTKLRAITFVAMESSGQCRKNHDLVWLQYGVITSQAYYPALEAVQHGFKVNFYNFPLCTLPHNLWSLARQSISPHKTFFFSHCRDCTVRNKCGGVFAASRDPLNDEILPIMSR